MKRLFFSLSLALFIAFSLAVATAKPAYGYVDPGSGFLAVQTIASVAAAFGYFLRRRIAAFFGKKEATAVPSGLQKGSQPSAD
jgi:Skp family chaperone for outer membrane proteins